MSGEQGETLLSVEVACSRILQAFTPLDSEQIAIDAAIGRVLAEGIEAPFDLPRFSNSSVDGFALRLDDNQSVNKTTLHFKVIGDIPAGSSEGISLAPGQAARIMTGAPVPSSADRVVPVEYTNFPFREVNARLPETIQVNKLPDAGMNIRPAGQDITKGSPVIPAGKRLNAADIGLLAMFGLTNVVVRRLPRIAIFSNGDELLPAGEPLTAGKIYDSNSAMLHALLAEQGLDAVNLGIARDDPGSVRSLFDIALHQKVDLIVTTAGVSVGAFDYVRMVLEEIRRVEIWRVNMRPGKPLTFGYYHSIPVISLPGNPVSAYVSFLVFVLPAIRKMIGLEHLVKPAITARLVHPIESDGRESYLRGFVRNHEGQYYASLTGHQGSGNLYALVQANALLILPSGVQSLPAGAEVKAWLLVDL